MTDRARVSFPELAVRLMLGIDEEPDYVSFHTFNVDADDEGKAHDYGHQIIEDAEITGDGTKYGYDVAQITRLASLWEHAPELFELVEAFAHPETIADRHPWKSHERMLNTARRVVAEIRSGELKYEGR